MVQSADGPFDWDERSARMSKYCPDCAKENAFRCQSRWNRQGWQTMAEYDGVGSMQEHHFTNKIVKIFLNSNLSVILILLATILGFAALWLTPREEDPQI